MSQKSIAMCMKHYDWVYFRSIDPCFNETMLRNSVVDLNLIAQSYTDMLVIYPISLRVQL